ncbi:hypothetical protein [Idiomarina sp.]|uniref:hypothetical protein n=1 Tax=Idiomarina sp. TaxID=1874361 RepID=UPI0025C0CCF7|nr:hypothetical protein [Idiomarina sp.]
MHENYKEKAPSFSFKTDCPFVELAIFQLVGFDYETQRYKLRHKKDYSYEIWVEADIVESIEYFSEDAKYYNTNEEVANRAERYRLFMEIKNKENKANGKSKSSSSGQVILKPKRSNFKN